MAIPKNVKILNGKLPPDPGVYLMRTAAGKLLYVGKATSLRTRVSSYFVRPADARITRMVQEIGRIEYRETPTAVEALMLEAALIKKWQPPYNVREKDDKSFVYLAFTREPYPQPVLVRGHELARVPKRQYLKIFGPFHSAQSVQAALDALRRAFPWTLCRPPRRSRAAGGRAKRSCFYRHLRLCPGVCTGEITPAAYRKIIRQLIGFFDGRRTTVIRGLEREMRAAAAAERFEAAAEIRNRLAALRRVRDEAVIKNESRPDRLGRIDLFGRLEAYDISNLGGQDAVGSLAVFEDGRPKRSEYRKFRIRTVSGANDVAMLAEVLRRRFGRLPEQGSGNAQLGRWPRPDLILIDGGAGQVSAARRVLKEYGLEIPLVGLAKGFQRKQDEMVFDRSDYELARLTVAFKPLLQRLRDEAHRFAIAYHRRRRARRFLGDSRAVKRKV